MGPFVVTLSVSFFQPLDLRKLGHFFKFGIAGHDDAIDLLRGDNHKGIGVGDCVIGFYVRCSQDGLIIGWQNFNRQALN